jgi:hypothetical protein
MMWTWFLQASSWVLLAGWFGSWGLFALVVAPTAFQVLHSHGEAGALVAPLLGTLHGLGIIAGVGLAVLAVLRRQGWVLAILPLLLAAVSAFSEYVVTPAINEVQPHSFGSSQVQEAARRFSMLHQTSRYLFGAVELGVLALILLHTRPTRHSDP